jgi:hypothetical protein
VREVLVGPQAGRNQGPLPDGPKFKKNTRELICWDFVKGFAAVRCTRPRPAQASVPLFYRRTSKARGVPNPHRSGRDFANRILSGFRIAICGGEPPCCGEPAGALVIGRECKLFRK